MLVSARVRLFHSALYKLLTISLGSIAAPGRGALDPPFRRLNKDSIPMWAIVCNHTGITCFSQIDYLTPSRAIAQFTLIDNKVCLQSELLLLTSSRVLPEPCHVSRFSSQKINFLPLRLHGEKCITAVQRVLLYDSFQ